MWLQAAQSAARDAASYIKERATHRDSIRWESKSRTDFVSEVDRGAESRIRARLAELVPGINFTGEEMSPDGSIDSGLVAVIDPLDGTTNFLHGYPAYCVSICIALNGEPVVGVVHDVARGGVYSAVAGQGAFLDGERLSVSGITDPDRVLLGTGIPFHDTSRADEYLVQLRRLMPLISGVRRAGSAALDLCDVASGRFDGFWEQFLHPWDFAAGILLVREAGGTVTNPDGTAKKLLAGPVVASNSLLHKWLLHQLEPAANP